MNIKVKMITAFLIVAFIVLIAGVTGILATRTISEKADVILDRWSPLKDVSMEAIISLQDGIIASSDYISATENLDTIEQRMDASIRAFDMWIMMMLHGSKSSEFKSREAGTYYKNQNIDIQIEVPATGELKTIIEEADTYHADFTDDFALLKETHSERIKYNFYYDGKSWDFINFLYLVELQHKKWLEQLQEAVQENREFTAETDPTQCFFGKWFYNYSINDPKLQEILAGLEPYHEALHQSALEINQTAGSDEKEELYKTNVVPIKNSINGYFNEMIEYTEPIFETLRSRERNIFAGVLESASRSEESLETLEEAVDTEMDRAMLSADNTERAGSTILIITSIAGVLIALSIGITFSIAISNPLKTMAQQSKSISEGDFTVDPQVLKKNDELGVLSSSFNIMVDELRKKAGIIERIAEKDLTVVVDKASVRDKLGESLLVMRESLNQLIGRISQGVENIMSGAGQVAEASQDLSEGATQQASAIEEISASVNQVSAQSKESASRAKESAGLAQNTMTSVEDGNKEMNALMEEMKDINASSEEIKKIVKVIDDIAFQINLLALNANVEAARAGKYGKGFAVVAEEVRNLAVRSAEAVSETSSMVEKTVSSIEKGNASVTRTADQLKKIAEGNTKVVTILEEISNASQEQAQSMENITGGLDQIEQVTQSNTAGAEESASASQELTGQIRIIRELINEFKVDTDSKGMQNPSGTPLLSE